MKLQISRFTAFSLTVNTLFWLVATTQEAGTGGRSGDGGRGIGVFLDVQVYIASFTFGLSECLMA